MSIHDAHTPTRECCNCHAVLPLTETYFHGRSDRPNTFRYDCKECRNKSTRLGRKSKPGQLERNGRFCAMCADLKHRRPRDRDCLCGGKYEPLPVKTLADVMREPRAHGTVYPDMSGVE